MAHDKGGPVPPPPDLHSRELQLRTLSRRRWKRIYRDDFDPCYFSPDPGNRFSSGEVAVLYLADKPLTSLWEIFWDDLGTRAPTERRIARAKLDTRHVTTATLQRRVSVFDATNGHELKNVSAPAGTFSGEYENCQAWARALASHPQKPEGILYPSARTIGRQCLALFGTAVDCSDLSFGSGASVSENFEILAGLADDHVVLLDEDPP